ncbi:cupin domain-containing protein [Rhodocaloribacter litoris]|uniref:cupin domain-containing protein n=1 Tax=Rhodocaloribacter litoris TaxID=2558931 RepID=UPI00141DD34C|nr:cupin domain-containing protein [Rhodocaloribacter litoris]QXD14009.1 cupin domain-containing protein [Rhodocaloribacter litoris]
MPDTLLGGLTPAAFLREYWQKKPLLVRGALPGFTAPIGPDELAALACEEMVESRLILEKGGAYPWELRHGPFEPEDFERLPPTHWTLLVQEVDRYVPAVAALRDRFRFLPNWRIDDVMVSFAPEGGGVGPHVDQYDVFLVQGLGRRRWRIHHEPVEEEHLVPDLDVRILANFEPDAEWVLEPGDLLYLPPRIPHEGVALGDCMTFSVGFRAPGPLDLVTGFLEDRLTRLDARQRYSDPDLTPPVHPGMLGPEVRAYVRAVLRELVRDDQALDEWFGRFITTPKRGAAYLEDDVADEEPITPEEVIEVLRAGGRLRRRALSELAFIPHSDGTAALFVAGETYTVSTEAAWLLTGTEPLDATTLAPHFGDRAFMTILTTLIERGVLVAEA